MDFMTRYAKGKDIDLLQYGDQRFKEESMEFDLSYKIPEGKLNDLGMRARFSHYRNDMPTNMTFHAANETRLNIDYSFKFYTVNTINRFFKLKKLVDSRLR